jgi:hypothetical protein
MGALAGVVRRVRRVVGKVGEGGIAGWCCCYIFAVVEVEVEVGR